MNERNKKAPILSQEDGHQKIEAHPSTHVDIKSPSKQRVEQSWNTLVTALKMISKQTE